MATIDRVDTRWDRKLSIPRSSIRIIMARLAGAQRLYQSLYDAIILAFLAAFIFSFAMFIFYTYILFSSPLTISAAQQNLACDGICNGTIVGSQLVRLVGQAEVIDRVDLLMLMGTTLSVTAGFYGVATQLYSGEWGGWITFRRIFVLLRRLPAVCERQGDITSNPISARYAESLVPVLFPTRKYLFPLTYDHVIIVSLLMAVWHFIAIVALGSTFAIAAAVELVIFVLILGASLLLVLMSLLIRPPLAVFLVQLGLRGPFLYYHRETMKSKLSFLNNNCIHVSLGIHSLLQRGMLFAIMALIVALGFFPLYAINPLYKEAINIIQAGIGVALYLSTIFGIGILIGIINIEFIHKIMRLTIGSIRKISNNIYKKYTNSKHILLLTIFFIITIFLLTLATVKNYCDLSIACLIIKFIIFVIFSFPVGYIGHAMFVRRKINLDFNFYIRYAEQILEMLRQGSGQAPPRPILLLELLAIETILSLMVLVSATKKYADEGKIHAILLKVGLQDTEGYSREVYNILNELQYYGYEGDFRLWLERKESSSRFFTPMGDLESYFVHVENLAGYALSTGWFLSSAVMLEGRQGAGRLETLMTLSVLMSALGLIGAARMGRIRSYTYPRALLQVTQMLLRIRREMSNLDEEVLQEIESVIPDLLSTLAVVTKFFPSAVCRVDNIELIIQCFSSALRFEEYHYCCQLITMTILPCFEDPEVRSWYSDIVANCPGIISLGPTPSLPLRRGSRSHARGGSVEQGSGENMGPRSGAAGAGCVGEDT
ncbi:MAG: hypothetical protein GXO43_02660 [Crenarchaeota archaeon]|nr:hypothetical protein [Thermoproteota archaeon]